MFVGVQCDGDTGENSPSNRSEALVTHIEETIATIILFQFQMAKLKRSISIYVGSVTVAQRR
jgi:hypothetical protein